MKKIKIMHFIYGLVNGGVEKVLYNYYSKLNSERYDLYIVAQQVEENCKASFQELGFTVIEVTEKHNFFKYYVQVNKIIKEISPDIVHSHMAEANFFPNIIAKINRIEVIISHSHNYYPYKSLKRDLLLKLSSLSSNCHLACSREAGIYAFGDKKYKSGDVKILHNAFDITDFKFNEETRQEYRKIYTPNNEFLVLNIGRMVEQKNQLFLIDVFKKIVEINKKAKMLIVGDGKLKQEIQSKIDSENLKDKIQILNRSDEINNIMMASDVLLFPTKFEGLGIVLVEAQMTGLPIVTSDVVPREAVISDNVYEISLNENAEVWAKKTIEICQNNKSRFLEEELLSENIYNINSEYKKMESIYESELKRHEK